MNHWCLQHTFFLSIVLIHKISLFQSFICTCTWIHSHINTTYLFFHCRHWNVPESFGVDPRLPVARQAPGDWVWAWAARGGGATERKYIMTSWLTEADTKIQDIQDNIFPYSVSVALGNRAGLYWKLITSCCYNVKTVQLLNINMTWCWMLCWCVGKNKGVVLSQKLLSWQLFQSSILCPNT